LVIGDERCVVREQLLTSVRAGLPINSDSDRDFW